MKHLMVADVQLWNLDEGVKVAELSCPSSVESTPFVGERRLDVGKAATLYMGI